MASGVNEIKANLEEELKNVSGVSIPDEDICIFNPSVDLGVTDFLYFFDRLEKKYHYPIFEIIGDSDISVMTMGNLAKAIFESATNH